MYRIRFHGRGGQGMKTASRILGSAFFIEGFEVQDAPRYGAERRGAPIFAYVRADRKSVNERGNINNPDLVVVSDDTLVGMAAAAVTLGLDSHSILLINSHESAETWSHRLNSEASILVLPVTEEAVDRAELPYVSSRCAAAAAALTGVVSWSGLETAIRRELTALDVDVVSRNIETARYAFELMQQQGQVVNEGSSISAGNYTSPEWLELPFENARISAGAIHAPATSVKVRTGLWRTMRPIIDYDKCSACWWICSTYCPDGVINLRSDNFPEIDYDHCKGCLVCMVQCPPHAIDAIPEHEAIQLENEGRPQ